MAWASSCWFANLSEVGQGALCHTLCNWNRDSISVHTCTDLLATVERYQAELIRYTYLNAIRHHVGECIFLNLCLFLAHAMALHHPTGLLRLSVWSPITAWSWQVLYARVWGTVGVLLPSSSIGSGRGCHFGDHQNGDWRASLEEWTAHEASQEQWCSVERILAARTSRLMSKICIYLFQFVYMRFVIMWIVRL